ncbi:unnamed protein product [Didymodactylos carnosus]|uniref:Methyltransferase type 12 domain-containing protein n=1 Tax=Didymodactylos carnosus TaxID=1234261 RepID=A0A815G7I4_9BILA|nr:unnamed protein product [Didymodactylos carnosus]CAF1358974.1 unnamed protein product [Didymodactylos carnosus]CAF4169346.1 unnamed protein product [Didymodactylos carnosus]CAF4191497.1 unnamed protein product [Didymodactylos carnosus]
MDYVSFIPSVTTYPWIFLFVYDYWVLLFICKFVWKCKRSLQLSFYNKNLSSNHLDIGVGSGWYLKHCMLPSNIYRIALADLHISPLKFATNRLLSRFDNSTKMPKIELIQKNILSEDTASDQLNKFDSISMFFLLHCIPGSMKEKANIVFPKLKELLTESGVIYGTTVLGNIIKKENNAPSLAYRLCTYLNNNGIMCNWNDDIDSLKQAAISAGFHIDVTIIGYTAMFELRRSDVENE